MNPYISNKITNYIESLSDSLVDNITIPYYGLHYNHQVSFKVEEKLSKDIWLNINYPIYNSIKKLI